jgi:hypothetical protein
MLSARPRSYIDSSSETSSMLEKNGDASKPPNVPSPILSNDSSKLSNNESLTLPPLDIDRSCESCRESRLSSWSAFGTGIPPFDACLLEFVFS